MVDVLHRPYGRHSVDVIGTVPDGNTIPTYYDRPAVKPSEWRWLIITYFFVGGLAGASQVIAGVVDLLGHPRDRPLVGAGRYIAFLGATISPLLLTRDLKTPSRWYNMLRLFRSTSPMSIGSWTLVGFGTFSGLAALAQLLDDALGLRGARGLARLAGIPAMLTGALLATYTGALLSATSTPLWSVAYRWLPALFGASATATATAALGLVLQRASGARHSLHRLERLALVASVAEFVLTRLVDHQWQNQGVAKPLEQPPLRLAYQGGAIGLGVVAPLIVHLLQVVTGRELRFASTTASLAALAGGYTQRAVILMAGKRSAERPDDYFRIAQQ